MKRINVTESFLPPYADYEAYMRQIWDSHHLTNQGPLLTQLEERLRERLEVDNIQIVSNGTIALQLALKALDVTEGEVITTPFSYVATTSSILWERCVPVFVDIEQDTFCIDTTKIEQAITPATKAIMAVHVFGFPCDVDAIEMIAARHNLKVIYDAAHSFGVEYKGRSLMNYGDASTLSFHATKLFHTIEGGAIVANSKEVVDKISLLKKFGHVGDEHFAAGINAKATEFQAAMGLCNLKYVDDIVLARKQSHELYDTLLDARFYRPSINKEAKHNYAYFPVLFANEEELFTIVKRLNDNNVFPRRYFYPSLNRLPYLEGQIACPVSEQISKRILCLPLYAGIEEAEVREICRIINQ